MMKKVTQFFVLFVVGIFTLAMPAHAAFDRSLDPVIVLGSQCNTFLNKSIVNVKVYTFNAATETWLAIPFQVDEFKAGDVEGKKEVVWSGDGILTALDEIVFMAKDMKDQAPNLQSWPTDAASKTNQRYEIVSTDPTTGEHAYAYIFYSATLTKSSVSYIQYKNDRVKGETYGIAHNSSATNVSSGLPDSLAIVGNNVDILQSWRIRAHIDKLSVYVDLGIAKGNFVATDIYFAENMNTSIKLTYSVFSVTVQVTAYHDVAALKAIVGPVRVIREHTLGIHFVASGVYDGVARIPITTYYYPQHVEFKPSFSLDLGNDIKDLDTDYIEFSQGLNSSSTNVKFYGNGFVNSSGAQDSVIDRSPENVIYKKVLNAADWPGKHWYGLSGQSSSQINNASFLTICDLNGARVIPDPTKPPALQYYDYVSDKYDSGVFGITGLRTYNWIKSATNTSFEIDARFRSFYFNQNQTRSQMQQLYNKYSQPMALGSIEQTYVAPPDTTPPGLIADLRVSARTDTTATLAWTAPGDDGDTGGPALYYVIRYSTIAPTIPVGNDWTWWSAGTTTSIATPPAPASPGTAQTYTITGLKKATMYYFRMNVVDDAALASGLSNTAAETTTPVELAAFTAQVMPSRQVLLQWTTESETNNLGFQIQRRNDQQIWQPVAFIPGFGTTVEQHQYAYTDTPITAGQWFYRLKQNDADGASEFSDEVSVLISAPKLFALVQNYPNPFNPSTTLSFQIPDNTEGRMTLMIYDMLGRQIRTLVNTEAAAGYYTLTWDGRDDSGSMTGTGVYIYQLRAGNLSETKKMIKVQ